MKLMKFFGTLIQDKRNVLRKPLSFILVILDIQKIYLKSKLSIYGKKILLIFLTLGQSK